MKTAIIALIVAAVAVLGTILYMNLGEDAETDNTVDVLREEALTCADGTQIQAQYLANGRVVLNLGDTPYELMPVISASGARYANTDGSFVFWNRGTESMVLVNNEVTYENCRVPGSTPETNDNATSSVADLIRLENIEPDDVIESPLTLEGEARGQWYFEATFPITLTNWDGLVIAEGYAEATSDWMTTEFVPFEAELTFTNPYKAGDPDFMKRGTLILHKSNASGLPENDAAYEITVYFAE